MLPTKTLQGFSKNKKLKREKDKSQYQMTKIFYLTKFYLMHKHDSLPCLLDFGNKKTSSLVQNSENAKDEGALQFYCRINIYIYLKGLSPFGRINFQFRSLNTNKFSKSLLYFSKIFNAVIIYLWPLFLNDINYVICKVSLNDNFILPCY